MHGYSGLLRRETSVGFVSPRAGQSPDAIPRPRRVVPAPARRRGGEPGRDPSKLCLMLALQRKKSLATNLFAGEGVMPTFRRLLEFRSSSHHGWWPPHCRATAADPPAGARLGQELVPAW